MNDSKNKDRHSKPIYGDHNKYTTKILKATALIDDTKTFFSSWDESLSIDDNFKQARHNNIFGKASRSRIEDILAIFRQRYFSDPSVGLSLSFLVKNGLKSEILNPLLYFYSVKSDLLLQDTVLEILWPMAQIGQKDVSLNAVQNQVKKWVESEKTTSEWSESTIINVSQHVLAALRDFGILEGVNKKMITPIYLPLESFSYISYYLHKNNIIGENLIITRDWNLFFLTPLTIERFFIEADQEGLLKYNAAGSIVRIDYPVNTLEEYAHVIARKKHY